MTAVAGPLSHQCYPLIEWYIWSSFSDSGDTLGLDRFDQIERAIRDSFCDFRDRFGVFCERIQVVTTPRWIAFSCVVEAGDWRAIAFGRYKYHLTAEIAFCSEVLRLIEGELEQLG